MGHGSFALVQVSTGKSRVLTCVVCSIKNPGEDVLRKHRARRAGEGNAGDSRRVLAGNEDRPSQRLMNA
jgi:hypothetical protein